MGFIIEASYLCQLAGNSSWDMLINKTCFSLELVIQPTEFNPKFVVKTSMYIYGSGGLKASCFLFCQFYYRYSGSGSNIANTVPTTPKEEQQDPELWQWQTIFPPEQNKVDRAQRSSAHRPNHKWHHVWMYKFYQFWLAGEPTRVLARAVRIEPNLLLSCLDSAQL